jgi:cytochrome d ubiquinol oxidase subunit II
MEIFANGAWLPLIFAFLMGLSMLIYAVLDGYDLGVGMLTKIASDDEKDHMIASIGPFWDANETWLVLGVGLLLVAFPIAHGVILTHLYLPVAVMLVGLIMRGVAFDFRVKAHVDHKEKWNLCFFIGSTTMALAQGYMLGSYILGFDPSLVGHLFCALVALCVAAGYCLIGATWLIMKTETELQQKSIQWARYALYGTIASIALISAATPLVSPRIFDKWFSFPEIFYLLPIPALTGVLIVFLERALRGLPQLSQADNDCKCWIPFASTIGIFMLCFGGLAYSFYPYIVPNQLTIVQSASAPESLIIMLVGALIVLPVLIGYTFISYRIFHGKATGDDLRYD